MSRQVKPAAPGKTLAIAGVEATALRQNLSLGACAQLLAPNQPLSDASVLVVGTGPHQAAAEAVLKAGNCVVCLAPDDLAALRHLAEIGGNLHAPGRIKHTEVGAALIAQLQAGVAGRILSLYAVFRGPVGGAPGIGFTALLWDAICLLDDCLDAPIVAVHATGGALFSASEDTAVIIAETANGVVATIDVANCLLSPVTLGAFPEVEIEVMAAQSTLRAAPFDRRIVVTTPNDTRTKFWGEDPAGSLIAAAISGYVPDNNRLLWRLDLADAVIGSLRARASIRISKGAS